jgi:site-specific DNA-methyltransferase (adenine-specific)
VLRDLTERVVIASKGRFDRALSRPDRQERGLPSAISLTKEEFIEATTDVWELPSERATRVGHPAPFPVELPLRLIELYTYEGDLVLDPFIGSGTTAAAAVRSRRHYVGYDTESEYVRIAEQRVGDERDRLIEGAGDPLEQARRDGIGARDAAGEMLSRCGFIDVAPGKRPVAGVDIAYTARDRTGRQWLFDFAGAFTTTSTGLRRAETLWKTLGKAAVIHAAWPEVPFVVLTTAAPDRGSAGDQAWRSLGAAAPPGELGAVYDVVELGRDDDESRLARYASQGPSAAEPLPPRPRPDAATKTRRRAPRAR